MNSSRAKDLIVGIIAVAVIIGAIFFTMRRDEQVMHSIQRFGMVYNSSAFRPTSEEQRIAKQFSDTTLPQLQSLGLIKQYSRTEIETIITVSGALWKDRSQFFKESLLEQIFIYIKVNGLSVATTILDDETRELYAQILPPDKRNIF
jgi:hypothetical protein